MYSKRRKSKQSKFNKKRSSSIKNKTRSKRKYGKFRKIKVGGFGGMADDDYFGVPAAAVSINNFNDFFNEMQSLESKITYYSRIAFGNLYVTEYKEKLNKLKKDYPEYLKQAEEKKENERKVKEENQRLKEEEDKKIMEERIKKYGSLDNYKKAMQEKRDEEIRRNIESGDCLGPNGTVNLITGNSKKIHEINVDDHVQTLNGFNKVVKVFKSNKLGICTVNNVILTNRHPIKLNGSWCYPEDVSPVDETEIEVYNFELERKDNFNENDHTIIVDGLVCATLGCGPKINHAKPDADTKWGKGYWQSNI